MLYLVVVRPDATEEQSRRLREEVHELAEDEASGRSRVEILPADDVAAAVVARAAEADLVILGLGRLDRKHRVFGKIPRRVADETRGAVLMTSSKG